MMNLKAKDNHTFEFRYHGEINGNKHFCITVAESTLSETKLPVSYQGQYNFKIETNDNITEVCYMDEDLAELHTTVRNLAGDIIAYNSLAYLEKAKNKDI